MAVTKKRAKKAAVKRTPVTKKRVSKKKVSVGKKATPRKKVVTRKKVAAKKRSTAPARQKSITTRQTKTQVIQQIAEEVALPKKEVAAVFSALGSLIKRHMQRRGSGEFTIPETGVKIRRVRKPARKARMGRNPATGEAVAIPAKPASNVIKVSALKVLKETLK